jgi:hypothetical protein
MRLAMLLRLGVVELKSAQTGTGHEEVRDVLNVIDVLLCRVLRYNDTIFISIQYYDSFEQ